MFAVIKLQGHQYLVSEGQSLRVDRIAGKSKGNTIEIKDVYAVFDNDLKDLGSPIIKGASVKAEIISHLRGRKVITYKYRPKARSRVKKGFRPEYTQLKIT